MNSNDQELPASVLDEWQNIVDLVAQLASVPVALIMRIVADEIEVFVSSNTANNPYHVGDKDHLWDSGLYCEAVTRSQQPLLVADALADPRWDHNPDLRFGLVSYLGVPIRRPDGHAFGTLCVLDNQPNEYSETLRSLLEKMRDLIEGNVAFLQVERELKVARDAAEAASRAKTDFLGRVSHDLRSPLTAIMGYSQLLARTGGHVTSKAKIIHGSAKHMLELVNDLIEYAKGSFDEHLNEQPVYILGLLDGIAQEASMLAQRRNNQLECRIDDTPPVLIADTHRLHRILLNLLDNAAKFTCDGHISLEVRTLPDPHDIARTWLDIRIADTGCGIPEAEIANIFAPFVRVRHRGKSEGSGLGLSIVRMLVQQMGGSIELSSPLEQGVKVSLRIPLRIGSESDMHGHQLLDVPDELPRLDGQQRCIWLVEDNDEIRRLLQTALEGAGFIVRAAHDGLQAIAWVHDEQSAMPALVLTDYLMPGANGVDVLNALLQRWPGLPVILLSATRQCLDKPNNGEDCRFAASLQKPINLGELLLTLGGLLELQTLPQEDASDGDAVAVSFSATALPAALLDEFRQLTELGAMSDLVDYANDLSERHPALGEFAQRVRDLALDGDLDGLAVLVDAC